MAETKLQPAWWLSWYSPPSLGPLVLHTPWWVTGRLSDKTATVVAAVQAADADAASELVYAAYDQRPDRIEFRFVEPLDRSPFLDRFPRADWMQWEETGG